MKKAIITILATFVAFSLNAEAKVPHHPKKVIKHHHKFDGHKITPIKKR
jgi:hypothetical protein